MSESPARPSGGLDERWAAWLVARNRRGLRTLVWIVLALYPSFGVLDWLLAPPHARLPLYATRALVTLVTLVMFRVAGQPVFVRRPHVITASYMLLCSFGISLMTVFMGGLASPYYAGLSLAMVAAGLLFVWPAPVVLATHASIIASFVLPNLIVGDFGRAFESVSNLFFLGSTAIVAATGQIVMFGAAREQVRSQLLVEETKARLEQTHVQLKQVDKLKSQFFANITHELRTPLTMILAPLESMLAGEFGTLTPTQRAYLEANWRNGIRLLRLINDLLDMAKLDDGFLRLRVVRTTLERLLGEVVEYARPLAARKRLTLEGEVRGVSADLYVDEEKLERVLVNLLANALRFTEQGTVRLWMERAEGEVRIGVEDTGIGIPQDRQEAIFERFSQGDASITRRYGGTGIGLAFAREIVQLHGGRIAVHSSPGQGSTFVVHLREGMGHFAANVLDRRSPEAQASTSRRADDQEPKEWAMRLQQHEAYRFCEIGEATERRLVPRRRGPKQETRVLVVEDNVEILQLTHLLLEQQYAVSVAQNGSQGLELALRELPDLIVTDYMMPEMDGLTMVRALRQDPKTADIPVIMLTAKIQIEDRVATREAGADIYLSKPFSPRELQAAIQQLLERKGRQVGRILRAHVEGLEAISAGLAHEIYNPLTYIKNAHLLIVENLDRIDEALARAGIPAADDAELARVLTRSRDKIARVVGTAGRGIRRIENIVEVVRRYAREGYPREPTDMPLDAAVDDVVALVAPRGGDEVVMTKELGGGGACVRCIPEEMHQVIGNLIQNAMDAVGPGGRVAVRTRREDRHAVLEVSDDGGGIPAAVLPRIFTPFFSTKEPGRGMGLGLAIVQRVVTGMGGAVAVDSVPGRTVFTLRMPVPAAASGDGAGSAAVEAAVAPVAPS